MNPVRPMPQPARDERSLAQLLKDLSQQTSLLLRQEVELAKAEAAETARRLAARLGELALGGAVAFAGALTLVAAVVLAVAALLYLWLSHPVANLVAALLVGAIVLGTGYALVRKALAGLERESFTPRKTAHSLQENKAWLQSKIQ